MPRLGQPWPPPESRGRVGGVANPEDTRATAALGTLLPGQRFRIGSREYRCTEASPIGLQRVGEQGLREVVGPDGRLTTMTTRAVVELVR